MSNTNLLTHFPILTFPTIFIKPPPHYPYLHHCYTSPKSSLSCNFYLEKYPFSRIKRNNKKRRRLMGERVIKISALETEDGDENISVLEQEALVDGSFKSSSTFVSPQFEATLNRLSKWLVAVLFGVVLLWRHDAEAVWAAMGSVLNSALSVALKKVLNQERPIANVRADPGMPSSHAQSIFFIFTYAVWSMVEWLGVNEITAIIAVVSAVFGSYLSWLRVSQKLHTIDQVVVGGVLGFCFSLAWLWSWEAVVMDAFSSYMWVQVSILLASGVCCLAFALYVIQNWFKINQ